MSANLKRILSLSLALVMAFSLCGAAMAYEDTDPPAWELEGFNSMEEFMDAYGLTSEEEYYEYVSWYMDIYQSWAAEEREYEVWKEAFLAENPGYLEEILAIDPPIWKEWEYESQEDFMYSYDMVTQEEYEEWLLDWYLYDEFYEYWYAKQREEDRISMGGPAEGVGVMWMDEYVKFPDAQPEITDGRTMIPVRAFVELLGAEVGFEKGAGVVTIALDDGREISFEVGKYTVTVTSEEKISSVEMDVAPYISGDRTYVPVRFFTEALGYDVIWDSYYKTAVILDRAAIIEELDAQFSIINAALTSLDGDPEQAYKVDGKLNADIIVFDSLDGDKTTGAFIGFNALVKGGNVDMTFDMDLTALVNMLISDYDYYYSYYEDEIEQIMGALDSEIQLIMNSEEEMMYMKYPALLEGYGLDSDAWMSMSYYMPELTDIQNSIGYIIYESNAYYGVRSYGYMLSDAEDAAEYIGDDCFEKQGSDYVLKYEDSTDEDSDYYYYSYLSNFELRIKANGTVTGSFIYRGDSYYSTQQIEVSFELAADSTKLTIGYHSKNSFKVIATMNVTSVETKDSPRSAPPAGELVYDEEYLFDTYEEYYGMFEGIGEIFSPLAASF